jgi:hypothetical protein
LRVDKRAIEQLQFDPQFGMALRRQRPDQLLDHRAKAPLDLHAARAALPDPLEALADLQRTTAAPPARPGRRRDDDLERLVAAL